MQELRIEKSGSEKDILENLKTHIKIKEYIPGEFYRAFYKDVGRPRGCKIESMMWYLILQSQTGITDDNIFLALLRICRELREFCGFENVPDAGKGSDKESRERSSLSIPLDSTSLRPVLSDFFAAHSNFSYHTFLEECWHGKIHSHSQS